MRVKSLLDEDFINYKKPSMFIGVCFCDWKCCKEIGCDICICQNEQSYSSKIIEMDDNVIVERYLANDITQAIVFGGFEPFLQFEELETLVNAFRAQTDDDIVIYTGYRKDELVAQLNHLSVHDNIIVKFGRYVPNQESHFDEILGVYLANKEQYAEQVS